jgi:hypothetical protein
VQTYSLLVKLTAWKCVSNRTWKPSCPVWPHIRAATRKRWCRTVERLVDYDEWFLQEVDKGLAAADRGEFVEHEAIRELIARRYTG